MLTRVLAYLRGLITRRRANAEADDELAFHVEGETAANIARGMSPVEARRVALRDLGGLTQTAEAVRGVRTLWFDALWRDVRHAVRSLRRTPAFTTVALAVLTLSIGASTAIFSVVDGVVLRGLPFDESDRLVAVFERHKTGDWTRETNGTAPQNFLDWRDQQDVFTGIAAIGYGSIVLERDGDHEPETLLSRRVTADFFPVLRTNPILGRLFTADNEVDGRHTVAVISYNLWQRRFGGAPDVIGARLPGQLVEFEVIGVLPPSFRFPDAGDMEHIDVWTPYVVADEDRVRGNSYGYNLHVIARLRDGVSIEQARAQMDQITARLAAETPRWFEDRVAGVEPLRPYLARGVSGWLFMLLAAVAGVLLIACVNLANLMLVRASTRRRELGIRAALGASRWTLARTLLVESLVLSLAGTALGVFIAWLGVDALRAAIPAEVPRVAAIAVDLRVLAVAAVTAILTGIAFGVAPALQFTRPSAGRALHDGRRGNTTGGGRRRLDSSLIIAEVALAVVLLTGAGLFLASFARVTSVDLGVDTEEVLTVRIRRQAGAANWSLAQQRNRGLLDNVIERVRAIPGVETAALVEGGVPLRGDLRTIALGVPGRELPRGQDLDFNVISPDYFLALRVPLLAGRFFDARDRQGSEPVAIINEATARRYFGDEDPVGKVIDFAGLRTVVGVVGNIRHDGPETDWRTQGFIPLHQSDAVNATLVLRTTTGAASVLPAVKDIIWSQFPDVPLPMADVQALDQYVSRLVAQRRFNMLLMGLFGALGLVIASIGVYGAMAAIVAQKTQEIGIRMALGALPSAILKAVVGRAVFYLACGMTIGLAGAWMTSQLVARFLFQIEPRDPVVFLTACVVLVLAGFIAAFVPARRAARVNPIIAMRAD